MKLLPKYCQCKTDLRIIELQNYKDPFDLPSNLNYHIDLFNQSIYLTHIIYMSRVTSKQIECIDNELRAKDSSKAKLY